MGVPTLVLAEEFISCLEKPKSQIFSSGRMPVLPSRSSSRFSSFRSRFATPCSARGRNHYNVVYHVSMHGTDKPANLLQVPICNSLQYRGQR